MHRFSNALVRFLSMPMCCRYDQWIKDRQLPWLYWLEERPESKSKVYVASYAQYGEVSRKTGQVDFFAHGDLLFKGAMEVCKQHEDAWKGCHVILIGHSVGGLAIKQLVLHAELHSGSSPSELEEEDRSLGFLRKLAGIFYFSTPHSDSADLTRLLGRSKSPVRAALAGLGKVTQRLNSQFSRRRIALRISAAAVLESLKTKVGSFTDIVVPEGSARMDVDFALSWKADHFDICMVNDDEKSEYEMNNNGPHLCLRAHK